jgi:hypothetical protein
MPRRTSPVAASSSGWWYDELLGIGLGLSHGLRLALREFLLADNCAISELLRPLERHAELIVGREEALDIRVTPRCAKALIARGSLALGASTRTGQHDRHRQCQPAKNCECSSGHVVSPLRPSCGLATKNFGDIANPRDGMGARNAPRDTDSQSTASSNRHADDRLLYDTTG